MRLYKILTGLVSALLITAAGTALYSCSEKPKGEPVTPENGVISIDAGKIHKGEVKFFRYRVGDKNVVFFAARSESGEIKTAFDACITCYPHKMGYRQERDCVVCIYCGTPFRIDELEKGKGNCVPIRINHRLSGDSILMDQKDIEAGAAWF